jgi:hypothetical protein
MTASNPRAAAAQVFPALLTPRDRLVSYVLAYGVGFLLPLFIGLGAAAIYREYWAVALPLPFIVMIGIAALFRPRAFRIADNRIAVVRAIGAIEWPLGDIRTVRRPPAWPQSRPVPLLAIRGLFGSYGWFWTREWGIHRIYLTDPEAAIELERRSGRRIVITPADPRGFVSALADAAARAGLEIEIAGGR